MIVIEIQFYIKIINFENAKKYLKGNKQERLELLDLADKIVDDYGKLSDELKVDLVIVCLLMCAVDGKVSQKEKNWLKKLIA